MQAVNGKLNAVVIETPEDALRSAELVDQAIERGEDPGELAGVPVTVKVNIDQAGYANTNGLKLQENLIADQDSPVVTNFRKAGAIIIGRTNTPHSPPLVHSNQLAIQLILTTPGLLRWFLRRCRLCNGCRNWCDRARHRHRGFSPISSLCLRTPRASPNSGTFPAWNPSGKDRHIGAQLMAVSGPLTRTIADLELATKVMSGQISEIPGMSLCHMRWVIFRVGLRFV